MRTVGPGDWRPHPTLAIVHLQGDQLYFAGEPVAPVVRGRIPRPPPFDRALRVSEAAARVDLRELSSTDKERAFMLSAGDHSDVIAGDAVVDEVNARVDAVGCAMVESFPVTPVHRVVDRIDTLRSLGAVRVAVHTLEPAPHRWPLSEAPPPPISAPDGSVELDLTGRIAVLPLSAERPRIDRDWRACTVDGAPLRERPEGWSSHSTAWPEREYDRDREMLTTLKGPLEQLVWRGEMALGGGGGRDRAEIEAAVLAEINDIRSCYRRATQADPHLVGRVNLRFFVRPDGTVHDATGQASTLPPSVATCVVEVVEAMQLAPVTADLNAYVRTSLWFGDLL